MLDCSSTSIEATEDNKSSASRSTAETGSIYLLELNLTKSKLICKLMSERSSSNEQHNNDDNIDIDNNKNKKLNEKVIEEETVKSRTSSSGCRSNVSISSRSSSSSSNSINSQADADSLNSMLKLTEYLLYDFKSLEKEKKLEETDEPNSSRSRSSRRRVVATTVTAPHDCLFDINEREQRETVRLADEIDSIQEELSEINDSIKRMQNAYKSYYENFLKWIDEKDKLLEQFIDYYEEYIQIKEKESDVKRNVNGNRGGKLTAHRKKQNSSLKTPTQISDDNEQQQLYCDRKPSIVYLYNVPTENRYLPLLNSR
jgi:hypothetical protein